MYVYNDSYHGQQQVTYKNIVTYARLSRGSDGLVMGFLKNIMDYPDFEYGK